MMVRQSRKIRSLNAVEQHRSWLQLVDAEGPFLAVPPLKDVWPSGMPNFRHEYPDRYEDLRLALRDFEQAWEAFDQNRDSESRLVDYRTARDEWITLVLRDVVGWADTFVWGNLDVAAAASPDRTVTVTPQAALVGPEGYGALVVVTDPQESLRERPADGWSDTPIDRLDDILRRNGISIGLVTDGRWWGVVYAAEGKMTASGIVDALDWVREPRTRDAFFTLISRQHLIGGDPKERLPRLFERSVAEAEQITEALGAQVRRAVELLIQAFSEAAAEARRGGLPDPLPADPHEAYEAAVTIMMRVVFLLFAEERNLLPTGELFEQGYGISRELDRLAAQKNQESEESLDATSLTWHRLLATSQALHGGASFESLRMPAYGGSLFDPRRFPFLTATTEHGTLAVTVSDRVLLHILCSVQVAEVDNRRTRQKEARRISFRDIDVEQIGYIYEGLLGYTCVRANEVYLGLTGTSGSDPTIALTSLEQLAERNPEPTRLAEALRKWISADQPSAKPSSKAQIARDITAEPEPIRISALAQAVGGDPDLRDRITGWLGLVRPDLRNRPFVVLENGLMVKETPSRKNAGAHYTPKSLAEEVVTHALQPLCYAPGPHQSGDERQWRLKSSDDLLALKVADIACGSGAFLVAAARYLADRVVEAWIAEDPSNAKRKDLTTQAIREVVANCLYGADINDMAVEMCKLSLWLVSLDPRKPFSFVDDKIFLGNSLLGLNSLAQIEALHICPQAKPKQEGLFLLDAANRPADRIDLRGVIERVRRRREQLTNEINDADPARSGAAKNRLLTTIHDDLAQVRMLADAVIAAGLPHGGKPGKKLNDAYEDLEAAASRAFPTTGDPDPTTLEEIITRGLTPTVTTDYQRWQPLHWVLAVPDVMQRGGFDTIIGNPPFLGGQKLTGAMGTEMRDWFVNIVADGRRGSADLVAYFFLRAVCLLQPYGTIGLIATNTLAQGDTREVGLDAMVADGFIITRAIQSRSWPASSANLEYAAVWGTRAPISDEAPRVADDIKVRRISTLLEPAGRIEGKPFRLKENEGIAFQGCIALGMGFVITPEEAHEWIAADPRNAEVLFPYLNGQDLNSRPDASASRRVIDFGEMTETEASSYKLPWQRVKAKVHPERIVKDAEKYPRMVNEWWKFWNARPMLRGAITNLSEVLAITRVSKTVMPIRVTTGQVFSDSLNVFATASYSDQAVLSSSLHQIWAIAYGSTLETRVRYTPSDVFETFPLPCKRENLFEIGRRLTETRREIMQRRGMGLTALYNLINDQTLSESADRDVDRLREIQIEIDSETAASYGWGDIRMNHGFYSYKGQLRWSPCAAARAEILERLLMENHRRATAEMRRD